jgi:hypothetical protein
MQDVPRQLGTSRIRPVLLAANVPPVEELMSNVVRFPRSSMAIQSEAEEHLRAEARMQLAAACGCLQGKPTADDVEALMAHVTNAVNLVGELIAIRMACQ